MKRISLFFLSILILGCINTFGNSSSKISLIATHCRENESPCLHQKVIRLNFENGEYIGKELILETDKVRFDLGKNRIYENRYLISNWGDVVDLKEKKILHKSEGEFFRLEGDKVFIQVNREDKDGLYVFDLKTKKYSLYKKTDVRMFFGELSPNGIRSADWTCPIKKGCGIEVRSLGKEEIFIKGGFTTQVDTDGTSSEFLDVPIIWLDDERMLTQKSNGELVIVYITGRILPLLKIKLNSEPNYNPKFYRDNEGRIYYWCGDDTFLIDVETKTYKEVSGIIGNELTFENRKLFKESLIYNAVDTERTWSTKSYLATPYVERGKNLGYPEGILIWNDIKKDSIKIEIDWGVRIIGWSED